MPITCLEDQLLRDEGLKLFPYRDSIGKLTIGIGRNLDDVGISGEEAQSLLATDVKSVRARLALEIPWLSSLDEVRRGVIENMCFNMGSRSLLRFQKFLASAQAGDWSDAAINMLDSLWAQQVGDRAQRLADQMETGEWR